MKMYHSRVVIEFLDTGRLIKSTTYKSEEEDSPERLFDWVSNELADETTKYLFVAIDEDSGFDHGKVAGKHILVPKSMLENAIIHCVFTIHEDNDNEQS